MSINFSVEQFDAAIAAKEAKTERVIRDVLELRKLLKRFSQLHLYEGITRIEDIDNLYSALARTAHYDEQEQSDDPN